MIGPFKGQNSIFSNFYPCKIKLDGIVYPSVENAYQASKASNLVIKKQFIVLLPSIAKVNAPYASKEWHKNKLNLMYDLVKQKFSKPKFKERLLEIKNENIVEVNWWNDTFWGVCNGKGHNHLGKILMRIRTEFQHHDIFS